MTTLSVDVWSDIACPWCHVGKRHLEAALARFAHRERVKVTWRAFELDPAAPAERDAAPYAERLGKKYGTSAAQAQGMIDRMTAVARADGLAFRFDRIRPGNTFDAHRLLHLARERGVQDAVKERFLLGYLSEGEAIGDGAALTRLAVQAGLGADEVASVLAGDSYAREVREDEAEARELGVSGVPFLVIGGRYGVSGAQPAEVLLGVLNDAWSEVGEIEVVTEGAVCGPGGCT